MNVALERHGLDGEEPVGALRQMDCHGGVGYRCGRQPWVEAVKARWMNTPLSPPSLLNTLLSQ